MITGSFVTQLGTVVVAIDDGTSPNILFDISSIGSINYDFDQTPDQVNIDRIQALYSYMNLTAPNFNKSGVDVWSRIVLATADGAVLPVAVTVGTFVFSFRLRGADISFDERSREVTMRLSPFIDAEANAGNVFSDIPIGDKPFVSFGNATYRLASPAQWIQKAMNRVFGNAFDSVYLSGKTELSGASYEEFIYDLPEIASNRIGFGMVEMTNNDFDGVEDGATEFLPTGTISYNAVPLPPDNIDPLNPPPNLSPTQIIITGTGTSFLSELRLRDIVLIEGARVGDVIEIISDTSARVTFSLATSPLFADDNPFTTLRPVFPSDIPALQVLKGLAGIEGAIFGTGFSKNFYVNRIRRDGADTVTVDWNKVVDFSPSAYPLSLGRSFVAQRSSKDREGSGLYGRWPIRRDSSDAFTFYSPIPNLTDFESRTTGNPSGTNGLEIGIAAGYPFLNKVRAIPFSAQYTSFSTGAILENVLTRIGLTSYFQALNNTSGGIMVEFTVIGAFDVKPWELIQFDTRAPEKYRDRQWRITSISYDLINNTARIKAYQIDDITTPVFPENPIAFGINSAFGQGLLPKGMYNAVQAQIGDGIGQSQDILFRTAQPLSRGFNSFFVIDSASINPSDFPDGFVALRGYAIKLLNPITLQSYNAVLSQDFRIGDQQMFVEPVDIGLDTIPAGSYVYVSQRQILSGLITGEFSTRIFAESRAIGILTARVNGGVQFIPVQLFTRVRRGQDLQVTGLGGVVYNFTAGADYDVGVYQDMDIRDADGVGAFIDALAGASILGDPVFAQAELLISPGEIRLEASEQIVLKAGTGLDAGKIATVGLYGDFGDGSVIDISADLVKINGIEFVEGTGVDDGYVQTDNYSSGVSGWKLFGDGSLEAQDVLLRGVILGFGATTDYFGNAINQSFNLSKRGLYFINDDTKIEESSIVQGDVDTTGITSKGLLFTYFDSVNSDYYTIELMYQRNGTFVPSSLIFKGIDDVNTTATDILEVRGPGSTNPNDLNYGFIKAHRDIIAEERVTIGTDLVISQRIFTQGINTIDTSTDFPYTVGATDYYVRIEDGGTIGGTITLPAATGSGRLLTFKDATGSAGAAPFTIQRAGTDTIDGATSVSLNTNFGTVKLIDGASGKWDRI
jgi:hypothetical protein